MGVTRLLLWLRVCRWFTGLQCVLETQIDHFVSFFVPSGVGVMTPTSSHVHTPHDHVLSYRRWPCSRGECRTLLFHRFLVSPGVTETDLGVLVVRSSLTPNRRVRPRISGTRRAFLIRWSTWKTLPMVLCLSVVVHDHPTPDCPRGRVTTNLYVTCRWDFWPSKNFVIRRQMGYWIGEVGFYRWVKVLFTFVYRCFAEYVLLSPLKQILSVSDLYWVYG